MSKTIDRAWVAALLALVVVSCSWGAAPPWAGDVRALLDGVARVPAPGTPGTLVAFGDGAFPVVVNERGETVLAAARVGRGRVVAFGHGGLVDAEGGEVVRANAARWLAGTKRRVRVFGVRDAAVAALEAGGLAVERLDAVPDGMRGLDVYFGSIHGLVRDHGVPVASVRRWLRAGGGLFAADTAWGYLQLKHAASLAALPCNELMLPAGLAWTNTLRDAPRGGVAYPVPEGDGRVPGVASHALEAARLLSGEGVADAAPEVLSAAVASVSEALASVEELGTLGRLIERVSGRDDIRDAYAGMAGRALRPETDPLACVLLDWSSRRWLTAPVDKIEAHPSSVAFPGAVPVDAERVRETVTLSTVTPGWRSTGLYVPPGEVVRVRFGRDVVGSGVVVQVGSWRDPQRFAERVRMRDVIRRWEVEAPIVRVATPVGGLLYVELPAGLEGEAIRVEVSGAVRSPHFVLGVTDVGDWRDRVRHAPGPWAELETGELVITVPSATVRDLEDPVALMEHWDRIHDVMHELEPRQGTHWADRQFRYVSDKKLSWGYMYCPSDGPIVVPMSAADEATDLAHITGGGGEGKAGQPTMWGWYHEMGHAHQNRMWTFDGLGEVTVNIFTVYAMDRVLGADPNDDAVARMGPVASWRRYLKFQVGDADFPGDPFTGLALYSILWQAFGWEPYREVFAAYRALPEDARPTDDQAKRDLWLVMMSEAVGRDLGPYFESWRVGVSGAALEAVSGLPGWMPEAPE